MTQYIYFNELPYGAEFSLNGNRWRKRSTRTAVMLKPVGYSGVCSYFVQRELCTVGLHSRMAS
jgi:hypothetical protein